MPALNLSDALKEAYASADGDLVAIDTIGIYFDGLVDETSGLPADVFLFNGNNPTAVSDGGAALLIARLEAAAPRNAGELVNFRGIPFSITRPEMTTAAVPSATLTIDNIGREMVELLKQAATGGKSIYVTYRQYIAGFESDGPENTPPPVFSLVDVNVGNSATGTLFPRIVGNRRFPFETYTAQRFKTLLNN